MSITDELREWAHGFNGPWKRNEEMLLAIADRIDAEHERAIDAMWEDAKSHMTDESMAEHGWVRLPTDADGVPIRMGDVMEGADKYDSLKKVRGKVITISFESDGIVDVAIKAWNSDGRSWHRAYLDQDASVYRHYHEPTVEDVLRDVVTLCHNTWKEGSAFEFYDVDDVMKSSNIAEYAAKLRLAEGEDA